MVRICGVAADANLLYLSVKSEILPSFTLMKLLETEKIHLNCDMDFLYTFLYDKVKKSS
ncbi:MAG: hypothetical protein IKB07_08080 [Lachnospiraceae bacterium]|nr:hypothetical protein [Lachnospiraceae bacterium]